jgi:Predicted phosphoesterase or phosphohydrolase
MTTFFTADLHLGHASILDHCARPYRTIAEHDADLVARWNSVVGPRDTVWVVGDFAYRGDRDAARRHFLKLNGQKHLIRGNHDAAWVADLPWSSVRDYADISVDGQRIILSHYALRVWVAMRYGTLMLYGHSHGRLPGNRQSCDVGVDEWNMTPVTLPEIKLHLETLPEIKFTDGTDETVEPEIIDAPVDPDEEYASGWSP